MLATVSILRCSVASYYEKYELMLCLFHHHIYCLWMLSLVCGQKWKMIEYPHWTILLLPRLYFYLKRMFV